MEGLEYEYYIGDADKNSLLKSLAKSQHASTLLNLLNEELTHSDNNFTGGDGIQNILRSYHDAGKRDLIKKLIEMLNNYSRG